MAREAKLNAQALARRDPGLMSCILSDVDKTTVSIDLASGEPSVTTHFSRDANYYAATFGMVGKAPYYKNDVLYLDDIYLMTMSAAPLFAGLMRQLWDAPWPAGSFADQWLADADVIRGKLKKDRQFAKILCLAADALVAVKNKGYVPIDKVQPKDLIWDGEEWVAVAGAVGNGLADVTSFHGTFLTPDHRIYVNGQWRKAEDIKDDRALYQEAARGLSRPSHNWADVWAMARRVLGSLDTWKAPLRLCRLRIRSGMENVRQLKKREVYCESQEQA